MRRRTRLTILAVLLVDCLLVLAVLLRKQAPPEAARLLPGADGFVYFDLKWVRRIDRLDQIQPVSHDPEYEQFIRETGFQFERDLDEAAFAIHYPGSSAAHTAPRFTEIFSGRWNSGRVANYLRKLSKNSENYHGVDVFDIPLEGRTVRVAMLSVGTVAVSNADDPNIITSIIDRSRKLASPFGGPALLRAYYKRVPFGSLAWAILGNPSRLEEGQVTSVVLPLDYRRLLNGSVLVASVRFLRALHVRAEAFFQSDSQASQLTDRMGTLLTLFHGMQPALSSSGGTDQDVKRFFDSLKVAQQDDRVVLSAVVPVDFIRKIFAEPPPNQLPTPPAAAEAEQVSPSPQPVAPKHEHKQSQHKLAVPSHQ